jgi:hypothetical protein
MVTAAITILQQRYDSEKGLYKLIKDRSDLIQKLRDFEKNSADPARLFASSFRLVEEEKFRKHGGPMLNSLESKIRAQVVKFEKGICGAFILW